MHVIAIEILNFVVNNFCSLLCDSAGRLKFLHFVVCWHVRVNLAMTALKFRLNFVIFEEMSTEVSGRRLCAHRRCVSSSRRRSSCRGMPTLLIILNPCTSGRGKGGEVQRTLDTGILVKCIFGAPQCIFQPKNVSYRVLLNSTLAGKT